MIATGHPSAAVCADARNDSGASPAATSPEILYFSAIPLFPSAGFSSKISGHSDQQTPQLMHWSLSIVTLIPLTSID